MYVYIVYKSKGYIGVVAGCTDVSMARAVDDVKAIAGYKENGEWVITDARHDWTSNVYHAGPPCRFILFLLGGGGGGGGCLSAARSLFSPTCTNSRRSSSEATTSCSFFNIL